MKVGLLGHGVVGSGVSRIIDEGKTDEVRKLSVEKILVRTKEECTDSRCVADVEEILNDSDIDTVVECMGGLEPSHTYVKKAMMKGKNVVTSNKKMLASFLEELLAVSAENHVQLYFEATTGGGIPWLSSIREIRRIDEISSFRGIFNGTTNYILSRMKTDGISFEKALQQAQQLGYAERDPSDDIDGLDVRYKTAISVLAAFDTIVKPEDIPCYGIRCINEEDAAFAERHHLTIKLIGRGKRTGDGIYASVMPCMLKDDDYLSLIPLNINGLQTVSETLGEAGFTGQGAGSLPTAHAMVQDLISISNHEPNIIHAYRSKINLSKEIGTYYLRSEDLRPFAKLPYEKDGNSIVVKNAGLKVVLNAASRSQDKKLILAEVEQ